MNERNYLNTENDEATFVPITKTNKELIKVILMNEHWIDEILYT